MSDRTLIRDILQPFRRAMSEGERDRDREAQAEAQAQQAQAQQAQAQQAHAAQILEGVVKRKLSYGSGSNDETPAKCSRSSSSDSPPISSPWEARRLKIELIEAKRQITILECRVNQQHALRKQMEILFESEKQSLTDDRRHKESAIAELQDRIKFLKGRDSETKEELTQALQNIDELKAKMEKNRQSSEKEIAMLKDKLSETVRNQDGQISEVNKDMEELLNALQESQNEKNEFQNSHKKLSEELKQMHNIQILYDQKCMSFQQAEAKIKELESERESYKDYLDLAKVSQEKFMLLPSIEKELVKLRSENKEFRASSHQKLLLEEQVHCLTSRLQSLEPVHQTLRELQTAHTTAERALEEWRSLGRSQGASDPKQLATRLQHLQQQEITLTADKLKAESALSDVKNELLSAKHESERAQTKLNDVQNIQRTHQNLIHRLQKKLLLVSRERDSYRQQLDCYEKELTISLGGEGKGAPVPENTKRLDSLEKALQGYRDLVANMEEEHNTNKMDCVPALQEQLLRLRDEVESLKKDNEMLRARKDKLEIQMEQQIPNQNMNQKILHLVQNPNSQAQESVIRQLLDKANAEVLELKQKLRKAEANQLEVTRKLSESIHEGSSKEVETLKSQLESANIKLLRMKELYTSSSQEYKNACYMLTGFKIDRTNNNYKLSSIYADSPDDYLMFNITDGCIEMVQTQFSATATELVELHLHHQNSIPVFLSALTLDLFKKSTVMLA